ncbi:Oxalate:formate antiporter [Echinococcus granulosus]|uniref:Oxalate:formate antiporter n=1 Tax=Echinococcus granulosus TaxID=6210 RepID=W6UVT9_ECHGR|nr:Oxalate:formate antiporter [Echinococcus granulosus]EUB57554.1 Oxalate:formate antiporter [Echinococcus granulosus]
MHQLTRDYVKYDRSLIKTKIIIVSEFFAAIVQRGCNYDAVKCRVAMNKMTLEDYVSTLHEGSGSTPNCCASDLPTPRNMRGRNICEELINQEAPNQDDLPYATATKSNTSKRQGSRSVDKVPLDQHGLPSLLPNPVPGNMIPYVASYVVKNFNPEFNNGLVVWMTAAPLMTQGASMPLGGILAPKMGVKVVAIIGSLLCSPLRWCATLLSIDAQPLRNRLSMSWVSVRSSDLTCSGTPSTGHRTATIAFVWYDSPVHSTRMRIESNFVAETLERYSGSYKGTCMRKKISFVFCIMVNKDTIHGVLVVIAGFFIHLSFGCMYTIGNMTPYLASYVVKYIDPHFNNGLVVWVSAAALAAQGLFMPFGGILSPRLGVKLVIILGCIINSGGFMLTCIALRYGFVWVLATHLLSLGLGVGFAYSVVMQAAASWFPVNGGFVIGLIAAGFGLGALVFTPIQMAYVNPENVKVNNVTRYYEDPGVLSRVPTSYLVIGGVMLGLQIIGCAIIRRKPTPKEDSIPELRQKKEEVNLSPMETLRCRYFYFLWLLMFCNIIPITLITSAYKIFGNEYLADDIYLTTIGTLGSLFNCLGRVFWGYLVDKFSFKLPIGCMLVLWSFSLFCFPNVFVFGPDVGRYTYGIFVCLMFFSMAGVFAMMPAATRLLFGPKNMATNYGMVFSAFSVGSCLSAFASQMAKGRWNLLFYGSAGVCILGLFFLLWIFDPKLPKRLQVFCPCAKVDRRRC